VSVIDISIIVPAYNEERYLARCLDSIAVQTVRPHEVLVVDNNSTDKTAQIAARYSFVRLLAEPRQGRVFARNAGFDAATGTVLARIDADAVLPADWVEHIAVYYQRPGALSTAWTGGAQLYNVRFPRLASMAYDLVEFDFNRWLIGHASLWGANMALPRAQWQRVAGEVCLRNDIHEDLDLAIHLHRAGCRIVPDRHCKVGAELRPVRAKYADLWEYVLWWPRTLQVHQIASWPMVWFISMVLILPAPLLLRVADDIARFFGRKPLSR